MSCERYLHHTSCDLAGISLPADHSTASWDENAYWRAKMTSVPAQPDPALRPALQAMAAAISSGQPGISVKVMRQLIAACLNFSDEEIVRVFPDDEPLDADRALEKLTKLQAEAMKAKEVLFENIRARDFAQLPSRRSAMFMFDASEDPRAFMDRMKFVPADRTLVEIEALPGSRLHRGDAALLNCNAHPVPEQERNANLYWRGTMTSTPLVEVLLEGRFRILRVLKPRAAPVRVG